MIGEAYSKFVDEQLSALLRFVSETLEQAGIVYSLFGGSLIGALRDGGRIPWDDDVDVVVQRKDYEAARAAVAQACETSPYACVYNARVFNVKPRVAPVWEGRGIDGFGLDIFVIDEVPADEKLRKKLFFRLKILQGMMKKDKVNWSQYDFKGKVLVFGTKALGIFFSEEKLRRKYDRLSASYAGCGSGLVSVLNDVYTLFETVYRSEWTQQTEFAQFGQLRARIYRNAREILLASYGDYMTPPPEDARRFAHVPEL